MKNKVVAILLAIFLGNFGFHKFYLGKVFLGLVYLAFFWTFVPGFLGLVEGILYATYSEERWNKEFNNLTPNSQYTYNSEKTTCPDCAEIIMAAAKKCKHCGSNLNLQNKAA